MENAELPDCLEANPCGPDRLVHIPVESDTDLLVPLDAVEMGIDIPIDNLDKVPLAPVSPWLSVEEESSCITEMNLDDIQLYLECSEDGGNSVSRPISLSDNHSLADLDGTSFIKSDVQLKISFPKYKEDVKKSKVFKCCCCKQVFAVESQLREHFSSAHSDKAYLCQVCMYNTKSKKYFQNHMNTKHNIIAADNDVEVADIIAKGFNCDNATEKVTVYFINIEESSEGNIEYQQRFLSNNESEPSNSENERTDSSSDLMDINENNKMSITHENNLPCFTVTEENQNLILKSVTEENQNLKLVTEENQYLDLQHTNTDGDNETSSDNSDVEPTTETVVGSTLELSQHEMRTLPNNVSLENASDVESDRVKCDICGFITSSVKLLRYHQMNMHNDFREKYTCSVCQFECLQKRTFERHKKTHVGKLDLKCAICEKSFYTQASYDRHLKTHNKTRNYQCEYQQCGKSFKTKGHLTDHIRKVHERKKSLLPKSSIDQSTHADSAKCESTASDHSKSKSENRPLVEIEKFTSDSCNSYQLNDAEVEPRGAHSTKSTQTLLFINTVNKKASANQSNITNKMKKFACNFKGCNKTFRDNFNLQNHIRTHDKTKLLHCDMCDFTCIQKTSLNYHCKTKH